MKKHLLTLILLTATTITFAQTVSYGFKFGINAATQTANSADFYKGKLLTGYNLGGIIDFTNKNLNIQSGLFLTTKGERLDGELISGSGSSSGTAGNTFTVKYVLTYLELPVNVLYKFNLVPGADMQLGGGPYLAYGLAAKESGGGVDYKGSFGYDPSSALYYKNPDYGINFYVGAVLQNNYLVNLQYGLGLANLAYGGGSLQNRVLGLSVGYLFR